MKLPERVKATGNWRPQFQEELKKKWGMFLPFRITQEERDEYLAEGYTMLHCYDYINGDFTAFN